MCRDARLSLRSFIPSAHASILCALLASACETAQRTETQPEHRAPLVDAAQAKRLAIARYAQLFGDKYFTRAGGSRYIQFPVLKESEAAIHVDRDDNWIVTVDPLVGLYVKARVDRDGKWVEMVRVAYIEE